MINFKNRDEAVPSALILLSVAILFCTLIFMIFVPKPSTAGLAKGRVRSEKEIQDAISSARLRTQQADEKSAPRLWQGDPQSIIARALAQLSDTAALNHVQMSSFRPQKQQAFSGVIELPFGAQVAGPYPAVRALLGKLDAPGSNIVLRSAQMAASDGATDAVTVSVGLSVYCRDTAAPAMLKSVTSTSSTTKTAVTGGTTGG